MSLIIKNTLKVIAFGVGVAGICYLGLLLFGIEKYLPDLLILSSAFTGITIVCFVIFICGQLQNPTNSLLFTLASLGLKIISEIAFVIFLFVFEKKISNEIVLIFFVLYLAFTLFLILNILKTLNKKSL